MDERSKLIVVIPGIMGSNLNLGKYQVWPRYFPDNIGVYEFYLPIGRLNIRPAGIMDYVYEDLMNSLITNTNYQVESFAYDWRKSNIANLERLHDFLLRYPEKEEIIIVAHSMGGILSKLFLSEYREEEYVNKISKLITMGTPWFGSMEAYKTLNYGNGLPFEKLPFVLTSEVSKKISKGFPSVYQLLPHTEYFPRVRNIHNVSAITINNNELNDWQSIFTGEIEQHFVECQSDVVEVFDNFYDKLREPLNIEHHEIIGIGNLTLSAIKRNNFGETSGYFKDGDGTVPIFSATSETPNKYFIRDASHQKLPKKLVVHEIINKILLGENIEENENVVFDVESVYELGFMGKIKVIRIACPVKVSLIKDGKSIYGLSDGIGYENVDELIDSEIEVVKLGNTVYLLLDNSEEINSEEKIIIEAFDEGPTNISIEQYDNGDMIQEVSFETFNINSNISAELNLSHEILDTRLIINNENNVDTAFSPSIQEVESDLILPATTFSVNYSHGGVINGAYVCSGEVEIIINDIVPGTYEIKDTYFCLRNNNIRFNGRQVVLDLEEGVNTIEVFSSDKYGNLENAQKITIYYVNDFKPYISFEILPHQYEIQVAHHEHYYNIRNLGEFLEPVIRFEVTDEQQRQVEDQNQVDEEVFILNNKVTIFMNNPRQRNIKIYYESILGSSEDEFLIEDFNIDENAIRSIYDGIGGAENLQELINGIDMQLPLEVKMFRIEGSGIFRKLTDQNISKSSRILITSQNKKMELIKSTNYIPTFYNLDESIEIEEDNSYSFRLKIIDKDGRDIRSLQLSAYLKIKIDNLDTQYTNEVEIPFNQQSDSYEGELDLTELQIILEGYWENTPIHSAELIIIKSGNNASTIRAKEIKIRRGRT